MINKHYVKSDVRLSWTFSCKLLWLPSCPAQAQTSNWQQRERDSLCPACNLRKASQWTLAWTGDLQTVWCVMSSSQNINIISYQAHRNVVRTTNITDIWDIILRSACWCWRVYIRYCLQPGRWVRPSWNFPWLATTISVLHTPAQQSYEGSLIWLQHS